MLPDCCQYRCSRSEVLCLHLKILKKILLETEVAPNFEKKQHLIPHAELNFGLGPALVFASEAKIEIEAKFLFHLEAKKRHDFACFTSKGNNKNLK
jgi:hypothetical protein